MSSGTELLELRITPHGVVSLLPYAGHDRWAHGVASRFAESEAAGLLALAAAKVPHHASASIGFWRDIAADVLRSVCHVPEAKPFTAETIAPPSAALLAEWVVNAPPMPGAEYLTLEVLRGVWQRLVDWTVDQAGECGGLGPFLET